MTDLPPKVSVVVPCYNGGRFLPGLLASLASQTFRAFETIIVDDGSTDPESQDLLASLPAGVRVIRQRNSGLPTARNAGIRAAETPFVLPLDCDDTIAPDFLGRALHLVESWSDSRVFVFSDMQTSGARTAILPRRFNPFDQLFLNQLPYALLMPRQGWLEVGGYDESMRDGYEDWEFNLRLIKAGYIGIRIAEPLFGYYVRHDGMQLSHSARRHGRIWRYIREKHPELYTPAGILAARRSPGAAKGRVPWWLAATLLLAAKFVPDAAFGRLFQFLLTARARANARRNA